MFKHEKQLLFDVKVEGPNSTYANLMQDQLGGANGELTAALTYFIQIFRIKNKKIKDLFLDIAAADLLTNIGNEQRSKTTYENLYRQIKDKRVRATIEYLLNVKKLTIQCLEKPSIRFLVLAH